MTEPGPGPATLDAGASRAVLDQARTENFPVAPRWLPAAIRRRLLDVYGFARMVDDAGDEARGDRNALLDEIEADVGRIYSGRPQMPLIASLQATVRDCSIPPEPLLALLEANRVDQSVTRYATFDDLLAYCELSANPVGHLVLHVFGAFNAARAELSDHVCSALQVIEHVQDVAEDHTRGRVYMPEADFAYTGATEDDLTAPSAPPALRALLALETSRAAKMLRSGSRLVGRLSGWERMAIAGFVGGGLAQVAALRAAGHDVLAQPVTASKRSVALRAVLVAARGRA